MKFNTKQESNVQQVGDIENTNVSIDTSNIDFIVTLLSTSLYSKPIESFIRETVSNAWDSHIEAGVDEPVILELGKDTEDNRFCRIQDFGVGLSPKRFDEIYKNIGSSTKRADNTQIGGFGIGRFSALAYSDVVHITTVYEGTKYIYMMYKDGNTVSIDMLHSSDTIDRNGLEVKLEIKPGDYENFKKAIKSQLVYFENLYVIDSTIEGDAPTNYFENCIAQQYNNFKIKKYQNFWVNTLDGTKELNLVLGKVRYPVRIENLDKTYSSKVSSYPISLRFDIGDLEVTPNREEILYSTKNKAVIEAKLDLAILEIDDLIMAEKTKDYTKLSEYREALTNVQYLDLLKGKDENNIVRIKLTDSKRNLTYNGQYFEGKNFLLTYNTMMNYSGLTAQYLFSSGQIKYNQSSLSIGRIKENFDRVYIADLGDVKNISKRYIRENFEDMSYFIKNDKPIRHYLKIYIQRIKDIASENARMRSQGYNREKTFYDHEAFKVIAKHIIKNLKKIQTFNDSKVPKKWISDTKAADKAKRGLVKKQGFDWKQNINVHKLRHKDYGGGVMTNSTPYVMKDLDKQFKSLTIYSDKNCDRLRTLYSYLKPPVRPMMVEVANTKMKLLDNINNFVTIDDFMSTDFKLMRNIATVEFLRKEMPFLEEVARIQNLEKISSRLATVIYELDEFVSEYESATNIYSVTEEEKKLVKEIYEVCKEKDYFNEEIKGLFLKHKKELLNSKIFVDFNKRGDSSMGSRTQIPENRINLIVDYLLARKLIRPNVKAVLKLKKETIFNNIEEDESN